MAHETYYAFANFLEEASAILEENAKRGLEATWRERIFNESFAPDMELSIPTDGMKQLTEILTSMERDVIDTIERFKKYSYTDDTRGAGFKVAYRDVKEIKDIKLKYLDDFMKNVKDACEHIASGEKTPQYYVDKYRDPEKVRRLKANIVETSIPSYMTEKELLTFHNTSTITCSKENVNDIILPFLMEFRYRSKSTDKGMSGGFENASFNDMTKTITKKFDEASKAMHMYHMSLRNAVDDAYKSQVEKFFYLMNTVLLQVSKYTMACYIRMMTSYISNMREVMRLRSFLEWKTGAPDSVVTESVVSEMDTCTVENVTELVVAANNLLNSMKNTGVLPSDADISLEEDHFDKYVYIFAIKAFKVIDESIDKLLQMSKEDPDMPLHEMTEECMLRDVDIQKILVVERAENMNFFKTVEFRPEYVCNDLLAFKHYLPIISDGFNHLVDSVKERITEVEANVNNVFPNDEHNKELIGFLDDLREHLLEYGKNLGKSYLSRLLYIGNVLGTDAVDTSVEVEPRDYFGDSIASSYNIIIESSDELDALNEYYSKLYVESSISGYYFEADEDKNKAGNASTKPVVNDGGATTTPNQDNKQQSGDGEATGAKGLLQRAKSLIQSIVEKVLEFFNKGSKAKNLKFLVDNKNYLLTRNYSNTSITMIPYLKNPNYVKLVEKIIDRAAAIDDGTLKTADEKTIEQRVFASVKLPNTDQSLDERLTHAFKVGTNKLASITYANNKLKAEIPNMITFAENYYNKFPDDMKALENKLSALEPLEKKAGSGDGDKTTQNVAYVVNCVLSAIRAARAASRDRCNDYMIVLSALAKGNKGAKPAEGEKEQKPKEEQNKEEK